MQRVIRNREEYAARHGYDLLNANAFGLVDKVTDDFPFVTEISPPNTVINTNANDEKPIIDC